MPDTVYTVFRDADLSALEAMAKDAGGWYKVEGLVLTHDKRDHDMIQYALDNGVTIYGS